MRPTLVVWFVTSCPSAALGAFACAVSGASSCLFTGARALCVLCAVTAATWRLFTGARAVCCTRLQFVSSLGSLPPSLLFLCLIFSA